MKLETKLKTKLLETKFNRIWKWNSNEIENKFQMNLKTKFKTNFKQNKKGNPIPNEIETASCMRTKTFLRLW
jgi:hypothetical protein